MKKIGLFIMITSMVGFCSACAANSTEPPQSTIIVEETLANTDESVSDNNEYQYIKSERLNKNKAVTDEASKYAEIENLMDKIAKETGGGQ